MRGPRPPKLPWYRRTDSPFRWSAEADGIGHAARRGVHLTVCGRPVTAPRFGWPVRLYCPNCIALLEEVPSTNRR